MSSKGAKSVKYLEQCGRADLQPRILSRLKPFLVPPKQHNNKEGNKRAKENGEEVVQEHRALIFLPPRYHLLLKFKLYQHKYFLLYISKSNLSQYSGKNQNRLLESVNMFGLLLE
jgi:hypothetical protein